MNDLTKKMCSLKFLLKGIITNSNHLILSYILIQELDKSLTEDNITFINFLKFLITLEKIDLSFDLSSKKLNDNFLIFIFSFSDVKKFLKEDFKKIIEEFKILNALKLALPDEINFF